MTDIDITVAPVSIQKMTLGEFIRLYETEGAFELLDGERINQMPPVTIHGMIIKMLVTLLLEYEKKGIGEVFFEVPFVLVDKPDWVKGSRIPDVMFFLAERLKNYREQTPDWKEKPFILVPDLAIEIISKNDSYSDLQRKVELYLQDGVKRVWVIDPHRKKVDVHEQGRAGLITLFETDTLTAGDIIPGFEMPIKTLFE